MLTLDDTQEGALAALGVTLCYVHGSVAAGTARTDSDLDIAVLYAVDPHDEVRAMSLVAHALVSLEPTREIDVAILNTASPLLQQAVASKGVLLYARSEKDRYIFERRALHAYEDSRRIVAIGQRAVSQHVHKAHTDVH